MAFSDPQTVTINAVAQTLARTSSSVNAGIFTKDDGTVKLSVSHAYNKRNRRVLRLDFQKQAPDPFTGVEAVYGMSCYLVVDAPPVGFTNTELKQVIDGFVDYLDASSGANVTKLLGGEN